MPVYDMPERIGLAGLGPSGIYHLEEISLQSDLRVVAAWDEDAQYRPPHPLCPNILPRFDDLLAREDVDCVLIAAPVAARAEGFATQAYQRLKHVALLSPPCAKSQEARNLLGLVQPNWSLLWVLPARREGLDFRAARFAARHNMLGPVESARIVSWGKAVPGDNADRTGRHAPRNDSPHEVFTFFAYSYLEELLQLIVRQPTSVYAGISPAPVAEPTAIAFFLSIGFRDGGKALIDVNLQAHAAVHTGWMLAGSKGSYCQQKTYTTEPSGEVAEIPVLAESVPETSLYDSLRCAPLPGRRRFDSLSRAVTIMRLIEAAEESSRTGQAVWVDDSSNGASAAD